MFRNIVFSILILFLTISAVSASYDSRTRASKDGIGYRSKQIDPLNPYATSSKRMLWSLLEKYELVPGDTEFPKYRFSSTPILNRENYVTRVRKLLYSDKQYFYVAKDQYGYGLCETNNYSSALAFMSATVKEHGRTVNTDRLIIARNNILEICNLKKSEAQSVWKEINKLLRPLQSQDSYAPWIEYLQGSLYFYSQLLDRARAKFSSIEANSQSWVKDTADYMEVRIQKANIDSLRIPMTRAAQSNPKQYLERNIPSVAPRLERAIFKLRQAMSRYLSSHPTGLYVETVLGLNRFVFWLNGDRKALIAATHHDFARIIDSRALVSNDNKMSFLFEAINSTEAIFDIPNEAGNNFIMHPLAVVSALLAEISNGGLEEDTPTQSWRNRFASSDMPFASFQGLSNYFELLLLARNHKYRDIVEYQFNSKDLGPLYIDALILKARAFAKIGKHMEAATVWLSASQETPLYGALTEVANAYVRTGQFSKFAKMEKTWMTDLSPAKKTKNKWLSDELGIDIKTFYSTHQPYRNLLRRGFETMVSSEEAASIYSDISLNPVIRFLAAEPTLRSNLLEGKYVSFISTAKQVFDSSFDASKFNNDIGEEAELVVAYRNLLPQVEALVSNSSDPDALTTIGYFLYNKKRFPKCFGEISLWEITLNKCDDEQSKEYPVDQVRPIDLFSKALSIYRTQPKRAFGEAKVLRILIFCFKGNEANCVRGSEDSFPKSLRKKYFQRLHKYFPEEAKRTPYWY